MGGAGRGRAIRHTRVFSSTNTEKECKRVGEVRFDGVSSRAYMKRVVGRARLGEINAEVTRRTFYHVSAV